LSASLPGCGQRSRVNENFPLPSRAFLARQNSRVTRSLILPAVFLAAGEAARCRRTSTKIWKEKIMTKEDNMITNYERYQANVRKGIDLNKAAVFDALADANITSVTAEFDGEGDSGGIESVSASIGDMRTDLPAICVPICQAKFGNDALVKTRPTLRKAVESLCYDCLTDSHDGWELNDGAYGTFMFNVAARSIELEFNGRFTDVATFTHTF
jgi:hypothetical protein